MPDSRATNSIGKKGTVYLAALLLLLLLPQLSSAQLSFGVSAAGGSRFLCGGRISYALTDNSVLPSPMIATSFSPFAKKRLFRIGQSDYLQLREKTILFEVGILEQFMVSNITGLELEAALGIADGWYNGSDRNFPGRITPVLAAGVLFRLSPNFNIIPRYQWCRITTSDDSYFGIVLEGTFTRS